MARYNILPIEGPDPAILTNLPANIGITSAIKPTSDPLVFTTDDGTDAEYGVVVFGGKYGWLGHITGPVLRTARYMLSADVLPAVTSYIALQTFKPFTGQEFYDEVYLKLTALGWLQTNDQPVKLVNDESGNPYCPGYDIRLPYLVITLTKA